MEKIVVDIEECTKCGKCVSICPNNALAFDGAYPKLVHPELCTQCGICEEQCPAGAIRLTNRTVEEAPKQRVQGNEQFVKAAEDMTSLLGLEKPPIGVALVKPGQSVPAGFTLFGSPTHHCVSILGIPIGKLETAMAGLKGLRKAMGKLEKTSYREAGKGSSH